MRPRPLPRTGEPFRCSTWEPDHASAVTANFLTTWTILWAGPRGCEAFARIAGWECAGLGEGPAHEGQPHGNECTFLRPALGRPPACGPAAAGTHSPAPLSYAGQQRSLYGVTGASGCSRCG